MKINRIISLANQYYNMVKISVPIEDVVITPGSEYYHPDFGEEAERPSKGGWMTLPPIKEFREKFSDTSYRYQIIYMPYTFGLKTGAPLDLKEYKQKIEGVLKYAEERIENLDPKDIMHQVEIKKIKECKYILDNFETVFKDGAINIIANKYTDDDKVGPLAVMHDLGHNILDRYENYFSSKGMYEAILNDYVVKREIDGEVYQEGVNTLMGGANSISFKILSIILAVNNLIPGSISEFNLNQNFIGDFFADLLINYNLSGESFKDLNIKGVKFYTDKSLSHISLMEGDPKLNIEILPREEDGDISSIKGLLQERLLLLETKIKEGLNNLVGKVMILW